MCVLKFLLWILQHVLPKGLQRMRDYGFLRGQAKALRVRIQLLLMHLFYQTPPSTATIKSKAKRSEPAQAVIMKWRAWAYHDQSSRKANRIRIMAPSARRMTRQIGKQRVNALIRLAS